MELYIKLAGIFYGLWIISSTIYYVHSKNQINTRKDKKLAKEKDIWTRLGEKEVELFLEPYTTPDVPMPLIDSKLYNMEEMYSHILQSQSEAYWAAAKEEASGLGCGCYTQMSTTRFINTDGIQTWKHEWTCSNKIHLNYGCYNTLTETENT